MNPWAAAGAGGANPFGAAAAAGANPFGAAAGAGGMPPPNMDQTLQMLENPMVRQMMDRMMENPAMMRQMIESNPMLQQTNPQLAQSLLENPAMMRQMMDPDNLRAMMQLQRSFGGAMPGMPGMAPPAAPAGEGARRAGHGLQVREPTRRRHLRLRHLLRRLIGQESDQRSDRRLQSAGAGMPTT